MRTTGPEMRAATSQRRWAPACLVSGTGLAVYILTPLPLAATLGLATAAALAAAWALAEPGSAVGGIPGATLLRVGLASSVAALAAYDASRILLSQGFGFAVGPFDALPHFGSALLGTGASRTARILAGTGFHLINGVGFSMAFVVLFRDRGPRWGIAWALFLEACMLGLYPRWLQLEQMREFATLSIAGHICFGVTLGWSSRQLLARGRKTGDR